MLPLRSLILLGIISLSLVSLGRCQDEYPIIPRVEDLPPLEDVFTTFRLPNATLPNSYDVTLRTGIHEGDFAFTGNVQVNISIVEPTNTITLHHRYLNVRDVRLWSGAGNTSVPVLSHSYNATFEFFTVAVQETLAPGQTVILDVDYNGTLRADQAGFYRSSYLADDGTRRWLATTQFESTDARHAFLCYDEPNKKATFTIRITHDPSYTAISNMPEASLTENADGTVTTEFEETPLMSTYLVAFIVSDFDHLAGGPRDVPQRTFARPNAVNHSTLMLSAGERIMDALEGYLGVNYSLPKMDQAGIPDFAAGAMENWGLVTYRESSFFYFENVTTYTTVLGSVKVVAHEYVHQWFGNLVSPAWWTYLWLNEGFARFVEHIGVNLVYPDWQMIDYFLVRTMQNVMQSDASATSRPMSLYVEHPNDIERQFSNIAYDKAGSVIRMFMNVLTESTFIKGLNLYLNEMSFSNAVENDLFSALNTAAREDSSIPADIDIATTMGSWSQQAGFPVVTVTRNYTQGSTQTVTLSQERYFTTQPTTPDNTTWWIPINYATAQNPNFDNTTADEWFPQNQPGNFTIQIPSLNASDWLIVNKQETGYYRVLYDQRNYELISEALAGHINAVHNLNRAQLIDDTYNFVRTNRLTYDTFFHITRFLEFENEYASWYPAITAFTTIDRYFSGHDSYPIFRNYVRSLIEHLYVWVGARDQGDEPHLRKYARTIAINWACNMGSSHCRGDAAQELRNIIASGEDFHQNVRDALYCASLRSGGQFDFNFLWNRTIYTQDVTTRNILLNALGCTTSRPLLTEYIRSSLNSTNSGAIPYQSGEPYRVFNAVYQNGLTGVEIAVDFLRENLQEAYTTFGSINFGNTITGLAQRIGSEQLIEQFELLLTAAQEANLATATTVNRARDYVEENLSWLAEHGDVISDWLVENF